MSNEQAGQIAEGRTAELEHLAEVIAELSREGPVSMVFICTHNSRRSHLSQVWAQVAANEHGLEGITTFSGGTEVTAFHPLAAAALEHAGFLVERGSGENAVHEVRASASAAPMRCFSKLHDDESNPSEGFVAIMTCSAADDACPLLEGAAVRIPLLYDDPGSFDGTPHEAKAYDDCCARIAREMRHLFRRVSELLG